MASDTGDQAHSTTVESAVRGSMRRRPWNQRGRPLNHHDKENPALVLTSQHTRQRSMRSPATSLKSRRNLVCTCMATHAYLCCAGQSSHLFIDPAKGPKEALKTQRVAATKTEFDAFRKTAESQVVADAWEWPRSGPTFLTSSRLAASYQHAFARTITHTGRNASYREWTVVELSRRRHSTHPRWKTGSISTNASSW